MKRGLRNILVTGGAGFIGSNFIRYLFGLSASALEGFADAGFDGRVINVDSLTYAGNLENLSEVDAAFGASQPEKQRRYFFERADICDRAALDDIFRRYDIDTLVHFAAESHVDRSILGPGIFVQTNVLGSHTLLEAARSYWTLPDGSMRDDVLFHHVSTDEVYGSLGETGAFKETTAYDPRSPYSASKAASDHLVQAAFHTYGLPVTLSNCSNNYGPFQFPEKLIPLMILHMIGGERLPVYGDGKNIRDWIFVEDHNRAVWLIMRKGRSGEKYNIGGENEWENLRLLERLIELTASECGLSVDKLKEQICFVRDRPGHDRRYAIDCSKIKAELGWNRIMDFDSGLLCTVRWYLSHTDWVRSVQSGAYRSWLERNYTDQMR